MKNEWNKRLKHCLCISREICTVPSLYRPSTDGLIFLVATAVCESEKIEPNNCNMQLVRRAPSSLQVKLLMRPWNEKLAEFPKTSIAESNSTVQYSMKQINDRLSHDI